MLCCSARVCIRSIPEKADAFISIRMDSELKRQADAVFAEFGINLSTAFNILACQSLHEGEFHLRFLSAIPAERLFAAILEAERIAKAPSVKGCTDLDELIAGLKA